MGLNGPRDEKTLSADGAAWPTADQHRVHRKSRWLFEKM
ncbi:hypothetical protein PI125_g24174 [Phytophthora idaei]|nr:hypothetical protein PI125_g24174 [Phytophthora idaei]